MSVRFEQVSLSAWDKTNAYQIGAKVKYGFMVGETFHPFGGKVAPTGE